MGLNMASSRPFPRRPPGSKAPPARPPSGAGAPRSPSFKKPALVPAVTTLWDYPSQHYGDGEQGSQHYRGATPSYVIWNVIHRFSAEGDTVLDPFVGSGIFPGLVQAKMNKPTVKDFNGISHLESVRDLYRNKVTHVLLVTSLSQLFADIGLFVVLPIVLKTGLPFVS